MRKRIIPVSIIFTMLLLIALFTFVSIKSDVTIWQGEQTILPEYEIDLFDELDIPSGEYETVVINMNGVEYSFDRSITNTTYIDPDVCVRFNNDMFTILNRQRDAITIYSIELRGRV